jgi:hypothetical protein
MTTNARIIEASVLRLRCSKCETVFPHLLFSGEDDTTTSGLCSLSACNTNEVVAAEAEADEWSDFEGAGARALEKRVGLDLNRGDLKLIRLIHIEHASGGGAGVSFQDFRRVFVPPSLVFSCPCCSDGESRKLDELSVEAFERLGGTVTLVGRLSI